MQKKFSKYSLGLILMISACGSSGDPSPTPKGTPSSVSFVQTGSGGQITARTFSGRIVVGEMPAAGNAAVLLRPSGR